MSNKRRTKTNPNTKVWTTRRLSLSVSTVSAAADTGDAAHCPKTTEGAANQLQGWLPSCSYMSEQMSTIVSSTGQTERQEIISLSSGAVAQWSNERASATKDAGSVLALASTFCDKLGILGDI